MDFQPLFREVRLSLAEEQDLKAALDIVKGKSSVSQVAESLSQEFHSFDGDGDILILSYSRDVDETRADEEDAKRVLGSRGDDFVTQKLIPAIVSSNARIEIVLRFCNLSTDTLVKLGNALRENTSFVGFNISGNPGNVSAAARASLRRAVVETMAPIQWYQGQCLSETMNEARQALARSRVITTMADDSLSPRTKVAELRRIQRSSETEDPIKGSSRRSSMLNNPASSSSMHSAKSRTDEMNERQRWGAEMRTKLQGTCSETDLDSIIVNLELLRLQETIDSMLLVPPVQHMYARKDRTIDHQSPLVT